MSSSEGSDDRAHLLTVIHAAERSGPPLLALEFLRWLHDHRPKWTLSTLSLGGGTDLLPEFARLGPIHAATPARTGRGSKIRRLATAGVNARIWASVRRNGRVNLVHVHCVGSMRVLDAVPPRVPVLCHAHELSVGQDLHMGEHARRHMHRASRFVAVSDEVGRSLADRFSIDKGLVERQWGFVSQSVADVRPDRRSVGVDDSDFVVMSAGVRHWRKGPELFVRAARATVLARPDIPWKFIWVGGSDTPGLLDLVRKANLEHAVQFVDHLPDPLRWISSADVFLLTAREDAFPLVCVEAASLGVPIVTFDNGGASELVRLARCGAVVRFPEIADVADRLIQLASDRSSTKSIGERGRRFAQANLTIDQAGPALLDTIERTMRRR